MLIIDKGTNQCACFKSHASNYMIITCFEFNDIPGRYNSRLAMGSGHAKLFGKRGRNDICANIDDFDRCALRRKIHTLFYKYGVKPSLRKLHHLMKVRHLRYCLQENRPPVKFMCTVNKTETQKQTAT